MEQDRIWNLLALQLTGEIQPAETEEFKELLEKDPDLKYYIQVISQWWNAAPPVNESRVNDAWQKHLERLQNKEKKA